MKIALILYPNQLFPMEQLPKVDTVLMVEDPYYFGIDREFPLKLHKQKIILHRASMRRYVEEVLWPAGLEVDYVNLDGLMTSEDIFTRCKKFEQLYIFDPVDDVITKRLLQARRADTSIASFEFLPNPNFYLKNHEVQQYFSQKHRYLFGEFYQWQRERFNILIGEDYKPVGGTWLTKEVKLANLPKDHILPSFEVFGDNDYVKEAIKFTEEHFDDNPGGIDFIWPTNHTEAAHWLADFVENRLDNYEAYENTIDEKAGWLYRSALSSSLNTGLLSPQQIVEAALARHAKKPVELGSLEKFVRNVLGWREFARGEYLTQQSLLKGSNILGHKRKMTTEWLHGGLGLPPFDAMIQRVQQHAYTYHQERQVVAGNLMLLCEIDPKEMYQWFSKLFIDSYDWVNVPSVYGMSRFIDGMFASEVNIFSSEYLSQVSNYEKGDWCDVWDGLYWRFIEKHKDQLKGQPETKNLVQQLEKIDPDRRRIISYRAEDFLNKYTR